MVRSKAGRKAMGGSIVAEEPALARWVAVGTRVSHAWHVAKGFAHVTPQPYLGDSGTTLHSAYYFMPVAFGDGG